MTVKTELKRRMRKTRYMLNDLIQIWEAHGASQTRIESGKDYQDYQNK